MSWINEKNWQKVYWILLLSFSQKVMKGYYLMMFDIVMQFVQKWSRLNLNEEIDVVEDMMCLMLDIIGLCGFYYCFNSFYCDIQYFFIISMFCVLQEVMC